MKTKYKAILITPKASASQPTPYIRVKQTKINKITAQIGAAISLLPNRAYTWSTINLK